MERKGLITLQGREVTLVGNEVKIGQKAPNCTLVDKNLKQESLSNYFGNTLLIMSVPSLDTSVCALEAKKFSEEINKLQEQNVKAIVVSMDLPFAQKRWCLAEKVDNLTLFSDYQLKEFGHTYGVYINEVGLLARAIFIIDSTGIIRYVELVKEVSQEPNYDEALHQIKDVVKI